MKKAGEITEYEQGYIKGLNDVLYSLYAIDNGNPYPGLDLNDIGDWSGIEEAMHAIKKNLLSKISNA